MEEVEVLNIDTSKAITSVKELRKALKDCKDQMANLEEGSDAFIEVAKRAGELNHQITEINQTVKGCSADFGDMLSNATQVTNGIIGGFTMAKSALSLFGVESEAVIKSMQQLQALMAFGQGLSQIDSMLKALPKLAAAITGTSKAAKLLKAVLQPKTFTLITAAITGLVIVWKQFGDKIKEYIPLIGKLKEGFEKLKEAMGIETEAEKKKKEINDAVEAAKAEYEALVLKYQVSKLNSEARDDYNDLKTQLEILEAEKKYVASLIEQNKNEKDKYDLYVKQYWELDKQIRLLKQQQTAIIENSDSYKELNNNIVEKSNTSEKSIEKIEIALLRIQNQYKAGTITEDEYYDKAIKYNMQILALLPKVSKEYENQQSKILDLINARDKTKNAIEQINIALINLENEYKRGNITEEQYLTNSIGFEEKKLEQIDKSTEAYAKQEGVIIDLQNTLKEYHNTVEDNNTVTSLNNLETSLIKLDNQLKAGLITEDDYYTKVIELEKEKLNYIKEGTQEYAKQEGVIIDLQNEQNKLNDTVEETKRKAQAAAQVMTVGFNAVGQILGELADQQNTNTKEGFERSKKLQISQALFNTFSSVIGAWNSAMQLPAPLSFIIGGIQSAASLTLGMLQVKKIKQTTFDTAGNTGNVSSNAVANSIIAPEAYAQSVVGAQTQKSIEDTRVYVVEADITKTQQKVKVQQNENKY